MTQPMSPEQLKAIVRQVFREEQEIFREAIREELREAGLILGDKEDNRAAARDFEAALKAAGYTSQKPSAGPVFGPPPLGTPIPGTKPYEPPVASPAPPVISPEPKHGAWTAIVNIILKLFRKGA